MNLSFPEDIGDGILASYLHHMTIQPRRPVTGIGHPTRVAPDVEVAATFNTHDVHHICPATAYFILPFLSIPTSDLAPVAHRHFVPLLSHTQLASHLEARKRAHEGPAAHRGP